MSKLADMGKNGCEERMSYKTNLANDVRSMLADFSSVQKRQAERARNERRAFLLEIRNQVAGLRKVAPQDKEEEKELVPLVTVAEPTVIAAEPAVMTAEPSVISAEPIAMEAEPTVIAAEAEVMATEPTVIATDSSVVAAEPSDSAMKPCGEEENDGLSEPPVRAKPGKSAARPKRTKKK